MNSPLNIVKRFVNQQGNPKELLLNFMQKNNSNPMINNLIQMAKEGKTQQVETFARNICKERGIDFDKSFADFMKQIKG